MYMLMFKCIKGVNTKWFYLLLWFNSTYNYFTFSP